MIGIFLAMAICIGCVDKPAEAPSATVIFFASADQLAIVDTAVRRYAQDEKFSYSSARLGARMPQEVVIHLVRRDVQIIGRDPFTPGRFQFFFYKTRNADTVDDDEMRSLVENFVAVIESTGQLEIERRM